MFANFLEDCQEFPKSKAIHHTPVLRLKYEQAKFPPKSFRHQIGKAEQKHCKPITCFACFIRSRSGASLSLHPHTRSRLPPQMPMRVSSDCGNRVFMVRRRRAIDSPITSKKTLDSCGLSDPVPGSCAFHAASLASRKRSRSGRLESRLGIEPARRNLCEEDHAQLAREQ